MAYLNIQFSKSAVNFFLERILVIRYAGAGETLDATKYRYYYSEYLKTVIKNPTNSLDDRKSFEKETSPSVDKVQTI